MTDLDLQLSPSDPAPARSAPERSAAAPAGDGTRQRREIGGRQGPEPTRYGDWEKDGRCIDF